MSFRKCKKKVAILSIGLPLTFGGITLPALAVDINDLTELNSALSNGTVNEINVAVNDIDIGAGSLSAPSGVKKIIGLTDGLGQAATTIRGADGTNVIILGVSQFSLENVIITSAGTTPIPGEKSAIYSDEIMEGEIVNSKFIGNHSTASGALYNTPGSAQESTMNLNIINSEFIDNSSTGAAIKNDYTGTYSAGGAIGGKYRGSFNGDIVNSVFRGNTIAAGETTGDYRGGAIGLINFIGNITSSTFEDNSTGGDEGKGGAIYTDYLRSNISNSLFRNNTSDYGGALYFDVWGGTASMNLIESTMDGNHARKDGGAIWGHATTPTIINSTLTNNTADNRGGAIFAYSVIARATNGLSTLFSGNMAAGEPNSVHVTAGMPQLIVQTEANSTVDMRDPFKALVPASFLAADIKVTKSGDGTWKLGGTSEINVEHNGSNRKALFDIGAGTLYLYGAGEVANPNPTNPGAMVEAGVVNITNTNSGSVNVQSGAAIAAGGQNAINTVTAINLYDNSTLKAGAADITSLTLNTGSGLVDVTGSFNVEATNASQNFTLDAAFTGAGASVRKIGDGAAILARQDAFMNLDTVYVDSGALNSSHDQAINRLEAAQNTLMNITGSALSLNSGEMRGIANVGSMEKNTSGSLDIYGKVNADGAFNMNDGSIGFYIDMDSPTVIADSAQFGPNTHFNVIGYSGSGRHDKAVLIQTNNEVDLMNMPLSYTLASNKEPLDFINAEIRRSDDGKDIVAYIDLSWKSQRFDGLSYSEAHGTFTLDGQDSYFELDSELSDRSEYCHSWDGKTLIKEGLGTLALIGENTYTGGSVVNDGHLLAKSEKAIGTGIASVNGSGKLGLQYDGTFANAVAGTGIVESNGRIIATGDMSGHTGNFNVASGSLGLGAEGQIVTSAASFNVANSTLLHGNGTIGHLNVRGGTVSPGHSIGTINVQGDLAFDAGSYYDVEVDPRDQSVSDRINVSGTADLGGATVRHIGMGAERDYPTRGEWTILRTEGGYGASRFASEVGGNYLFLDQFLTYPNPNEVHLVIERNEKDLDDFDLTPNQDSTAKGIDDMNDDSELYERIIGLPVGSNMPDIYDQLSGELHPTLRGALQTSDRDFARTMKGRMNYGGALGGYTAPGEFPVWIDLEGFTAKHTGGWGVADAKHRGVNVTIGAEKQLNKNWAAGGAIRYGHSEVKVEDRASKGDIDTFLLGGYAGRQFDKFNLTLGASYGVHRVRTERNVYQWQLGQKLEASYTGQSALAFVDLGYTAIENEKGILEPYVAAGWNSVWMESFKETGGYAALDSTSERQDNPTSQAGLRGKYVWPEQRVSLTGDVSWFHLYDTKKTRNHYRFVEGGNNRFTIRGIDLPKDAAIVNGGVNIKTTHNSTVRLSYEGMFGTDITAHQGNLTYMLSF